MSEVIKVLKAYYVQGDEYGVIRFATSNVAARREGADDLDEEFSSVSCKRMPGADKYAETGEVPARALIEEFGWWQECAYCNYHVDDQTDGRVWDGDTAYCCAECEARMMNCRIDDEAELQRTRASEQAAIETALAKFPGITDVTAHTGHNRGITLYFRFPGGIERASWDLNGEVAVTSQADSGLFKAFLNSIRCVAISETQEPK